MNRKLSEEEEVGNKQRSRDKRPIVISISRIFIRKPIEIEKKLRLKPRDERQKGLNKRSRNTSTGSCCLKAVPSCPYHISCKNQRLLQLECFLVIWESFVFYRFRSQL